MRPKPLHGTRSRYVGGCRCEPCRAVASDYAKRYHRKRFQSLKVSADVAREHILHLKRCGLGAPAIGHSADMSPATVLRIARGKQRRIYAVTERKVLSVTAEGIADGALVDPTVTRTLLRELLEEGWTRRELLAALGRPGRSMSMLYHERVTARTEMRVEKLHRRLMQSGSLAI